MDGTVIYVLTTTPSEHELHNCPDVVLSSPHTWDPHKVSFPKARRSLGEEVGSLRLRSAMNSVGRGSDVILDYADLVFSLDRMTRKIATLSTLKLVNLASIPVIQMFR